MADRELFQFQSSHFNEKARWALDLKHVPHVRTSLLPGPHVLTVKKLTGDTQVPVLREGDRIIAGSARIIDHLEQTFPTPPLYPEDPALRREALEIQREFDTEVGPAVRLALFFDAMDADFAVRSFGADRSPFARAMYRLSFTPVSRLMRSKMKINAGNAESARERTRKALDFVAERGSANGHLVGDGFTVADLACAALLMVTVPVGEWGGPVLPRTAKVDAWLDRWAGHPGTRWIEATYRQWRRPHRA